MTDRPGRSRLQQAHLSRLITNIQRDRTCVNTYTFELHNIDDVFSFQRLPFYNSSVQDFYEYYITSHVARQMDPTTFSKDPFFSSLSVALTRMQHQLHSLTASHPRFGTIQFKILDNANAKNIGKRYVEWMLYLFNNRSERKLLSQFKLTNIIMNPKMLESVQNKRSAMRSTMVTPLVKYFKFTPYPSNVGETDKAAVFLSDLHIDESEDVFAKGLISWENGFDAHPWITGSGDHINSCHVYSICSQFVHLVVRNARKLTQLTHVDPIFVDTVNIGGSFVICDSDSKFQRFLELGSFSVRLLSLVMIEVNNGNDGKKGKGPGARMKVPFAFELKLIIEQNGRQCVLCRLTVCQKLLSSVL